MPAKAASAVTFYIGTSKKMQRSISGLVCRHKNFERASCLIPVMRGEIMSNTKGFDELQKKLKKMAEGAKELEGEQQIPIPDLLTEDFVSEHTKFRDAQKIFDESGFEINNAEDFKAIPDDDWDKYIAQISDFESWSEMLKAATAEHVKRKMGW
jgi:hypothetical protein